MDEIERRVRRSMLRVVAISVALGFLIGFAAGGLYVYHSIDQVVVVPMGPCFEA